MKKALQVSNISGLVVAIFANYISASGIINGTTVADISDKYHTLFTPAGYAFSIWGLIYLMLAGFVIYQATGLFKKVEHDDFILQIGWWFVLSCLANSLWIITWVFEYTGLSVLIICFLLFSLIKIVLNTNMERWDAPLTKIFLLWWPFCIYSGWVTVAVIANISAYLQKLGWGGFGLTELTWAIIMVIVAGLINLLMTWRRNMREFALVGAWALIAIAVANGSVHVGISWTAGVVAAILPISSGIHAFQNRDTSPAVKCQEWYHSL